MGLGLMDGGTEGVGIIKSSVGPVHDPPSNQTFALNKQTRSPTYVFNHTRVWRNALPGWLHRPLATFCRKTGLPFACFVGRCVRVYL